MRPLALLVAVWLATCVPPAPDPALGVVRVAIGDSLDGRHGWTPVQTRALVAELAQLAALGPEWRLASEGEADVVVRAADLGAVAACGRYTPGLRYVEVDPACAMGLDGVARAAGHELVHWLTATRWGWTGHLCDWAVNESPPPGCHPTIRCPRGLCLMAPGLRAAPTGGAEDYVTTFAAPTPQEPDATLVRACARAGRCE